jgi:uncharacterized protein
MDTEPQPEPESGTGSALSSRAALDWHTWQPRIQWAVLVLATVLCLHWSTRGGVQPLVIGAVLVASAVSSIANQTAMVWSLKRATVNLLMIVSGVSYFG